MTQPRQQSPLLRRDIWEQKPCLQIAAQFFDCLRIQFLRLEKGAYGHVRILPGLREEFRGFLLFAHVPVGNSPQTHYGLELLLFHPRWHSHFRSKGYFLPRTSQDRQEQVTNFLTRDRSITRSTAPSLKRGIDVPK